MMKYSFCLILICWCMVCNAQAVDKEKESAVQALKKIVGAYKSTPYLSFDVAYYYADEQSPSVYLDSLKGKFKLNGIRYWYLLNNTECISNEQYTIVLYKEDSLMYLLKAAAAMQMAPAGMIDSFLVRFDNLVFHNRIINGVQQVIIDFPGKGAYKSVQYNIDTKTGLLTGMRSVVQSSQLMDPALRGVANNAEAGYAIVDMQYSNYSKNVFSSTLFDMNRYFKKEGKEYTTVAPYNSYKIFLGTPDL